MYVYMLYASRPLTILFHISDSQIGVPYKNMQGSKNKISYNADTFLLVWSIDMLSRLGGSDRLLLTLQILNLNLYSFRGAVEHSATVVHSFGIRRLI